MKFRLMGVLALMLLLPLAACDNGTGTEGPGTFTLLLTDDPAFDMAVVTIDRIELAGSEDGEGGGVVLMDQPVTQNLLDLSNDVMTLVEDVPVPSGTYSQLRFVISAGCVAMGEEVYSSSDDYTECGDVTGELQMPSYGQSGLKVQLPGGSLQVEGGRSIVLLDFVVGDSFGKQAGNSGRWVLRPHIKATHIEFSGTLFVELTADEGAFDPLSGSGLDPAASLADFAAQLAVMIEGGGEAMDGPPVLFTDDGTNPGDVADDGIYTAFFNYLVPGDYKVYLELTERDEGAGAPYDFTTTDDILDVTVTVGDSEDKEAAFNVTCAFPTGETASCGDTGGTSGG
jgi:hypothetical protein